MSRASCLLPLLLTSIAIAEPPKLVISEIQYDPSSPERQEKQTEWVELFNAGTEEVSLKGLQITSGTNSQPEALKQKFSLGEGVLKPGGYIVVGIGTRDSYEGLGLPPLAAVAGETRIPWLSNSGDSVAIRNEKGELIDQVVYKVAAPWPEKTSGCSIQFVLPAGETDAAKANDDPKNWVRSSDANADVLSGHGSGTPGAPPQAVAVASTTQPAAAGK